MDVEWLHVPTLASLSIVTTVLGIAIWTSLRPERRYPELTSEAPHRLS